MNLVDLKFCGILSTRLDRFKVKQTSPYKANCRCPLCGDSQKSKSLSRGWFIEKNGSTLFHCFNCGASHPLWRFLKTYDTPLYNEYVIDSKFEKHNAGKYEKEKLKPLETLVQPVPNFRRSGSPLLKIKKISQLRPDHPVKLYVEKRKIPLKQHHKIYYAPKFNAWVNSIIPDKLSIKNDKPRLVLPLVDVDGQMFGFQGRAFDKESIRYITIMINPDKPKLFGLDYVDFNKRYYVVEGPIDSLFLSNAIAMAGADGNSTGLQNMENAVFVYDNEPRNKEIVNRMTSMIERGYNVCIWPKNVAHVKDINDMVLAGYSAADVELMIDQNTYRGLQGRLAVAEWRRCDG